MNSPPLLVLAATVLASFSLPACSKSASAAGPELLHLARNGAPGSVRTVEAELLDLHDAPEGWARVLQVIEPGHWTNASWPGVYSSHIDLPGTGTPPIRDAPHELRSPGGELKQLPLSSALLDPTSLVDGTFFVLGDELLLLDRERRFVERDLDYFAWIEHGYRDAGRVHLPGLTGEGLLLLPGERIDLDVPPVGDEAGAVLQFSALAYGSPRDGATTTVVIEIDGEQVFTIALPNQLRPNQQFHRVPLPEYRGGQLSLRAVQGAGLAVILAPLLGPAEPLADEAARPPDIIIFLADTFRADNLEPWGGAPELAPFMNAFAAESQVFLGAHAPASWTLPSQAALLSGLYPFQLGLSGETGALAEDAPTLARVLSAAGYRTVAVTDGLMVSERYGMDRGFELFLEEHSGRGFQTTTLGRTQRILEADDGRPLFLFVQTYRVHTPYKVSTDVFHSHPELFGSDPDLAEWDFYESKQALGRVQREFVPGKEAELAAAMDKLRRIYLGGVVDLDRGFGEFLTLLADTGHADAYLLLTSDHGEAFGEHEAWTHGSSVFEEQIRVPFVLRGPGLGAGLHESAVSLVDVPPTLTALARLAGDPAWVGRSLFDTVGDESCVFSFECRASKSLEDPDDYSVFTGRRKVIGRVEEGRTVLRVAHAFDLESDPGETVDLESSSETWPAELLRRWNPRIEEVTLPVIEAEPLELSDADRAALRAMGYGGD